MSECQFEEPFISHTESLVWNVQVGFILLFKSNFTSRHFLELDNRALMYITFNNLWEDFVEESSLLQSQEIIKDIRY